MTQTYYERNKERILEDRKKQYREWRAAYMRDRRRAMTEDERAELRDKKRQWSRNNPTSRLRTNLRGYLRRAGVEEDSIDVALDDLLQRVQGKCDICGNPSSGRRLHVDHDHASGQIRGVLCHWCNTGLGSFRDNPERLQSAISYLTGV